MTSIGAASTPPLWNAASLRTMVEAYETIIVGHVDGVADVRYEVKAHPNGLRVEQPPLTVSSVSVLRVISAPRVKEGQTISFVQAGGPTKDGSSFVVAGDRLVEIGQTYLMFLNDLSFLLGRDEFNGPPFGRFVLRDDGIIIPNGWDGNLGVGAVTGVSREEVLAARYSENPQEALAAMASKTVDEAAAEIVAEIALAPLPPLPTIMPFFGPPPTEAAATPVPSGDTAPQPGESTTTSTPTPATTASAAAPTPAASP